MKKIPFIILSLFFLSTKSAHAKETEPVKLNLPWGQIQKLLKLDQNEVRLSWEEFQALAQRTTQKLPPKFALSQGEVVLTKEEFNRLVVSLLPPTPEASTPFITKGTYKGRVVGDSIVVAATLELLLDKKDDKPLRIDLFPGTVAFKEILLDEGPVLSEIENGRLFLTTKATGHHLVKLQYSLRNQEGNKNQQALFPIQRTSLTQIEFEVPEPNVDMDIDQALQIESRSSGDKTVVSALLPPADSVRISWHTEVPQKEKGPAKIYVDGNHFMSIEEDALRVRSILNFQILQNSINAVSMEIPKGFAVIDVQGGSLKEWTETGTEVRTLQIPFEFARQGSFQVVVTCEQIFSEKKVTPSFSGFKIKGATREKGFLGVELRTPAEASVANELVGLERVDTQELPPELVSLSNRPLLFGFKYLHQPFRLNLAIERHTDLQVLSSVIDSANGVSWLADDGKLVHQITYRLRNTWKQFLEVELPKDSKLWSVFVGGQPVKPSADGKGKLLVPLSRSENVSGSLSAFDVELVYIEAAPSSFLFGRHQLQFPIPDMIVSQMSWAVVLPPDELTGYFGKDLAREKPAQVAGLPLGFLQRTSGGKREMAKNAPMAIMAGDGKSMNEAAGLASEVDGREENMTDQIEAYRTQGGSKKDFVALKSSFRSDGSASGLGRVAGVLPVRAHIPVSGQTLRFSKSLIVKDLPLQLPLYYISSDLVSFLKWMLWAGILIVAFRSRHKIMKTAKRLGQPLLLQIKIHCSQTFNHPLRFLAATVVLTLLASLLSTFWMVLSFLAFALALTRWIITLTRLSQGGRV